MIAAKELRALGALRAYTDADLEVLVTAARASRAPAGTWLCREGAPGASCFIVVSGAVEVVKATAQGERVLATLPPGSIAGQVALVDRGPRTASLRAAADTILLELSRDVFEHLLAANSPLAMRFQEQIAIAGIRQLRAAISRLSIVLQQNEAAGLGPGRSKDEVLSFVRTAVNEWGMSMDDLDAVEVVRPDGIMSNQERALRRRSTRPPPR